MISFPCIDGLDGRAYEVKATTESKVFVVMIHEWWGLNDYIMKEAEKLADSLGGRATVLALDLYDGKVATTREAAARFVSEANEERIRSIIQGALAFAGPDAEIGTIGWCFGGGWSLQTALMAGKQAKACVIYYGMPETDPEKLKVLSSPVLGIFGDKDAHITPEVVSSFASAMKQAGKELTVRTYDAVHAFANPSNPAHDEASTRDAYVHTLKFFKGNLFK